MTAEWIELRGVNTHNKGAHLMMIAVANRLQGRAKLTVSPNGSDFDDRGALGFHQTLLLNQLPAVSGAVGGLIPGSVKDAFGLVASKDVGGVLDAAGFAYSDSFSIQRSKREAKISAAWKKRGVPRVFLPQAFGPFTNPEQAKWTRELLDGAALVYARDRQSLDYVTALGAKTEVRLAPDFTIGLKPGGIPSPLTGEFGAIVPNAKMLSHTKLSLEEYTQFLADGAAEFRAQGLRAVVVVHEHNDRALAKALSERSEVEIFESPDPLVLKRVLSDARIVVASRFHALVSALSSRTPVVALGWSHKYAELLEDFGAGAWMTDGSDAIAARIRRTLTDTETAARLDARVPELLAQNERMWTEVESVLGIRS
ncbi:polysaccharide pyruvyl transferase family protein [Microbacterium testaceum]|uniref:polysaccharide pyruvyl transferase family protein n=1 Tax=Microbacterium testaceum TaxID=2033 RepID=UPI0012AD15F6|nr:polysaccharide pyruvyl transferase family protein [Microbacterium testaceum]